MTTLIDICGWAGILLILWAYYLISAQRLNATNSTYQLLNLFGSALLGINVFYKQAWPALVLEIIWAGIALSVLLKQKNAKST
jgi:hypothetical protein